MKMTVTLKIDLILISPMPMVVAHRLMEVLVINGMRNLTSVLGNFNSTIF